MRNKLSFQYFKDELKGLEQEKDNAHLVMQDQKRQLIYDKEEIAITKL